MQPTTPTAICPTCKRKVTLKWSGGAEVFTGHGRMTFGSKKPFRFCPMSGKPYRPKRTRLGHRIQKALREEPTRPLPVDPFAGFGASHVLLDDDLPERLDTEIDARIRAAAREADDE